MLTAIAIGTAITITFALLIAYIAFAVSAEAEHRARKMREKDNERHGL